MFDGLKLSAAPVKAAEPAQGAKEKPAPKRGMFDGLKLPQRTPTPEPATELPARAEQGQDRDFRRAVERASRSAEAVLQARASGGDRESAGEGKSVAVCVDSGGRRRVNQKKTEDIKKYI